MRVLIVLDHRNLLSFGSTIAIAGTLNAVPGVEVHVASVGVRENVHFFAAPSFGQLHTRIVDDPYEGTPERGRVRDDPYLSNAISALATIEDRLPFINRPSGVVQSADKRMLAQFPSIVPGVKVCNSVDDVHAHLEGNRSIVLKPCIGTGGQGIVRVDRPGWIRRRRGLVMNGNVKCKFGPRDDEFAVFTNEEVGFPCLAVTYQPRVRSHGDKRVAVFDGHILGAVLRKPAPGTWIANKARGGLLETAEPDEDDIAIVTAVDPILKEMGVVFYGIDTLVDGKGSRVLSEINTTSPNGLLQIQEYSEPKVLEDLSKRIAAHLS
jgi:glutathione synthase